MTLTEKKQKLISDFRETSKVATSDLEKLKIAQATKATISNLKSLEIATNQSIETFTELVNSKLTKETQLVRESINRLENDTKNKLELLKITHIDGGEIC